MTKTIIPSSAKKIVQPGKNQQYVNSRQGGRAEQELTKRQSIKHENPKYFKAQSDRKNADSFPFQTKEVSRGVTY